MNKNKLIWSFVLVLIMLISLPIAYAQAFTGSRIYFILINAAVIGIVLFILQAFLVPGKESKEQTSMWIIVILASLLISWFFGSTGYIWQGPLAIFLNVHVLVNAVIIAAVLYFVFGLLEINKKLGSPEGKTGYGILLFIISLVFAVKLGNQWIWNQQTIKLLFGYLFGEHGILNPSWGLWTFIVSGTVLAFFFNGFLLKGTGNEKVNYALALVIAASMANAGVTMRSVVILSEVIFVIVLQSALKDAIPEVEIGESRTKIGWLLRLFLALFLVGWASAAATYGTEYQGVLAWFVGTPLYYMGFLGAGTAGAAGVAGAVPRPTTTGGWIVWILKWGLGIFILLALLFLIPLAMARGEGRAGLIREGATRLYNRLLERLKRNRAAAFILGKHLEKKEPTLKGELPNAYKDLRIYLYTLMNFMLRHQVWKAKGDTAHNIYHNLLAPEENLGGRMATPYRLNENIKKYIEGSPPRRENPEAEWTIEKDVAYDAQGNQYAVGFSRHYYMTLKLMDWLKGEFEKDLTLEPSKDVHGLVERAKAVYDEKIKPVQDSIDINYTRYKGVVRRWRTLNFVRAQRLFFLDMENMYGKYERGWCFVRVDAKPEYYRYVLKDNSKDRTRRIIDWEQTKNNKLSDAQTAALNAHSQLNIEHDTEDNLLELNLYGWALSDVNGIQIEGKDLPVGVIRKFKKKDMVWYHRPAIDEAEKYNLPRRAQQPRFQFVVEFDTKDWDFALGDIEKGKYHFLSRNIESYIRRITEGHLDMQSVPFEKPLDPQETGFDIEAAKNPCWFAYWGRKHYWDEKDESLKLFPVNPYPTLSIMGSWEFIRRLSDKRILESELAKEYLELFRMQYYELGEGAGGQASQQQGGG